MYTHPMHASAELPGSPALRAYNKALKSEYGHYELKRGRTLPEGFTIVKVSAHVWPMRCECK